MPMPTPPVPQGALPIPKLDCIDFTSPFTAAYLGNGLIGLRPQANPLLPAQAMVTGQASTGAGDASLTAAYPFAVNIVAGGAGLQENPRRVTVIKQSLDMATGELTTHMKFAASETLTLDIQVLQFLSRSAPCLACQEIRLTASSQTQIEVIPQVGSPAAAGLALAQAAPRAYNVQGGQTCVVHTLAAIVPSAYHPQPQAHAQRLAAWAGAAGFQELSRLNRQTWLDLWQSRIRIVGDVAAQRALDAAFFYLHSSCHASCLCGTGPMGLSLAEPYGGRVLDDMDYWLLPAVAPAAPDAALAMLRYRLAALPAARAAAHLLGLQGALVPLQASAGGGEEACPPSDAAAGDHRSTPRVALAFWEYYLATADEDFLRRAVWPILSDFARWIESRGRFTAAGFEIVNADGTRNDPEMNILCRMALVAASHCAAAIGYDPPPAWTRLAGAIVIPLDRQTGLIAPGQRESLAPLLLHDPSEYGAVDADLLRRTLERDEQLRQVQPAAPEAGHATVARAVAAAIAGDRAKAAQVFHDLCEQTWSAPYGLCAALPGHPQGEHLTTHAAMLMAAMYAFTGLRISSGDWARYPARLPESWQKIEIGRLWVGGVPMRVTAVNGQRARLAQQ
ncbi:MAG: hypothetical protein LLG01_12940 [Planctomycetaceae bacterium]|nr:hypothetical protein [Planctomycetaceae bacterium]